MNSERQSVKKDNPLESGPFFRPWQVKPFSAVIADVGFQDGLPSRLTTADSLSSGLVTHPAAVLLDEKRNLFFYQGLPVHLAHTTFRLMALLAKRPCQVVTR